jgi:hypothetical protein
LGIALFFRRARPIAFVVGAGFHTMVAIIGRVAPDLNITFVATYLFFSWDTFAEPAELTVPNDSKGWRWIRMLDLHERGIWRLGPAGSLPHLRDGNEGDASGWGVTRWVVSNIAVLNPIVLWFIGFWIYFMLPLAPWTWCNHPTVALLTIVVLAHYVRQQLRKRTGFDTSSSAP